MARKPAAVRVEDVWSDPSLVSQSDMERLVRLGLAWEETVRCLNRLQREDHTVHRITIKGNWSHHDELLIILVADTPEGPVVAFHQVDDLSGLWKGLWGRLRNGSLRWREDQYASDSGRTGGTES